MAFIQKNRTSAKPGLSVKAKETTKIIATLHAHEVQSIIHKGQMDGIFHEYGEETICANCGEEVNGSFCRKCNQSADNYDLLDHDENHEEREVDDHSDSEDADDYRFSDDRDDLALLSDQHIIRFSEALKDYFANLNISDDEITIYIFLIKNVLEKPSSMDDPLDQELRDKASEWSGKPKEFIETLWNHKPFDERDFTYLLEEWLNEGNEINSVEEDDLFLEIRKVGEAYIPIVHDEAENIVPARGKRSAIVKCRDREVPASVFLKNLRKRNENLERILEAIIDMRRDFLDAPNEESALKILKEKPLELVDIASNTGIDVGIVSRHFSSKSVVTPYGVFVLRDLISPRSRSKKGIAASAGHEWVLEVIKQGDSEGHYYSDRKDAEVLKKTKGVEYSRENIKKIRKYFDIASSRDRKKVQ